MLRSYDYDLDELCSLSDLCDRCIFDDDRSYLFNRFTNDLEQYKAFCSVGSLGVAAKAKDDAHRDLFRLLGEMGNYEWGDADTILSICLPEYMDGWTY